MGCVYDEKWYTAGSRTEGGGRGPQRGRGLTNCRQAVGKGGEDNIRGAKNLPLWLRIK